MSDEIDIGQTLRAARERRGMTQNEIAEATRIKLHLIQAIEQNDFRRIEVPLYGKGFVKLYAERVGLDPDPLTRQYLMTYARAVRPSLHAEQTPAAGQRRAARTEPPPAIPPRFGGLHLQNIVQDISGALRDGTERLSGWLLRIRASLGGGRQTARYAGLHRHSRLASESRFYILAAAAALLLIFLLVFGVVRLGSKVRAAAAGGGMTAVQLRLSEEPPASYIEPRAP